MMTLVLELLTEPLLVKTLPIVLSCVLFGCAAQVGQARPPGPFAAPVGPIIIAHRGGSLEAPENTLASVKHGVSSGADWQEIDVTLTLDEEVVVIHDDELDRTTSGHGLVEKTPLAQIRALSAGRPTWSESGRAALAAFDVTPPDFGDRFAEEKVPTLAEVLAIPDTRLMIEMKKTARSAKLVEKVVAAIRAASAYDRVAFASFETELLGLAHRSEPSIPLIGIAEEPREIDDKLHLPLSVFAVRIDLIEDALQKAAPNVAVWSWTSYSVAMAEAVVERGAHGVITDVPQAVVKAFRTPPPVHYELSQ